MVKGSHHSDETRAALSVSLKGRTAWNKANGRDPEKARLRQKKYILAHPERRKKTAKNNAHLWRMKNLYHLTPEQYKDMYEAQGGKCAIPSCSRPIEAIDHDHETGITRGLLCKNCNSAIGFINDSPEKAEEISAYLRGHYGQQHD